MKTPQRSAHLHHGNAMVLERGLVFFWDGGVCVSAVCVCVCQALFQRVTHRMGSKQFSTAGGHRRTIELCPTKLSMETSGYPAWPAGRTCSVNQNRLLLYQKARLFRLQVVHECSEKYFLLTHRFAVFTHA